MKLDFITSTKGIATFIVATVVLLITFYAALYIAGMRSEPFAFSKQFIAENYLVEEHIGQLHYIRMAHFGYNIAYRLTGGYAKLKVLASGTKRSAAIYLTIRKTADKWTVEDGRIVIENGDEIPIK